MTAATTPRHRLSTGPLWHFLEHQFHRYRSTWSSTIVTSIANPLFFLLAIGFGLGSQVDATSLPTEDYVSFVGPGVIAAVAMLQGGGLSLWPTMAALKWEGTYQAVLSTPLTPTELATGHILWIGFRGTVSATLYLTVLTLFGVVSSPAAVLAPIVAGLTAMAFAAPLSAYAATRDSDDTFSLIMRVILTPLFLFSGAFFPVEQLPDSVEWFSRIVPVWHGVELCRHLVNGTGALTTMVGHGAAIVAVIIIGWLFARRTFAGRLAS